jgi:hypothetical protein
MEFQTSLLYWRVVEVTFQCGSIDFVWGTRCVSLKSSFRYTSPILPGIGENGGSLAITTRFVSRNSLPAVFVSHPGEGRRLPPQEYHSTLLLLPRKWKMRWQILRWMNH